ncbi:unnamed protein product, partial [Staurois parvus]
YVLGYSFNFFTIKKKSFLLNLFFITWGQKVPYVMIFGDRFSLLRHPGSKRPWMSPLYSTGCNAVHIALHYILSRASMGRKSVNVTSKAGQEGERSRVPIVT